MDIDASLKAKVDELANRNWDVEGIKTRIKNLEKEGILRKTLSRDDAVAHREQILDRVQQHAEENNFILRNCAQGTALALLEEFGLGSMEIIKALTTFPGIGGTGEMCGGVTGSLVAFGLFFGTDDRLDFMATGPVMGKAQEFLATFKERVGCLHCADIQENVVLGCFMDPGKSPEHMKAFEEAKGFEKCGLAPGLGARIAAEFILDSMTQD